MKSVFLIKYLPYLVLIGLMFFFFGFIHPTASTNSELPEVIKNLESNMIMVEGGSFKMGCSVKKNDCFEGTLPVHKVSVSSFKINKYEITVREFKEFVDRIGYKTSAQESGYSLKIDYGAIRKIERATWKKDAEGENKQEGNHPVTHISWDDAQAFCDWLSEFTGNKYRLPTEAEWEFASRGGNEGNGHPFAGGTDLDELSWYNANSDHSTNPVGLKQANELGLFDMSGNLMEFCSDFFDKEYYEDSNKDNPKGPSSGINRSIRGGCFNFTEELCRIETRIGLEPNQAANFLGFRVVAEID